MSKLWNKLATFWRALLGCLLLSGLFLGVGYLFPDSGEGCVRWKLHLVSFLLFFLSLAAYVVREGIAPQLGSWFRRPQHSQHGASGIKTHTPSLSSSKRKTEAEASLGSLKSLGVCTLISLVLCGMGYLINLGAGNSNPGKYLFAIGGLFFFFSVVGPLFFFLSGSHPGVTFTCPYCGHMLSEHDLPARSGTPFSCPLCGKTMRR